jgi:glycosyltransferase involved in cell wall biosynthesis
MPQNTLGYCLSLSKLLKENEYDIIHIHKNSAADLSLLTIAKSLSKAKIIVHSHNTMPARPNALRKTLHIINRPVLRRLADYYFACSDVAAEWLYSSEFVKKNNVEIVKNGIITKDYTYSPNKREQIRSELGLKNKFVIGNVGRFTPQKNHKFLIDILKEFNSDTVLVLVGVGELMEDVKSYAKNAGVEDRVLFLGERNDVALLLQAMDVFAMPSLYEGLPVSCVEAQASGLPVLLSDNTSRMCSITSNVKYISIDNVDNWCKAMNDVKDNFERKSQIDSLVKAGYDMDTTAEFMENFYFKIVNR